MHEAPAEPPATKPKPQWSRGDPRYKPYRAFVYTLYVIFTLTAITATINGIVRGLAGSYGPLPGHPAESSRTARP